MNTRFLRLLTVVGCLLPALHSFAATLYVDLNSPGPVAPYSTWGTAATNIQDAVDASSPGDLVLVTNGAYRTGGRTVSPYSITNRVMVSKAITVQSVNGSQATTIVGHTGSLSLGVGNVRCVYLTNGASLVGFTLTNGATLVAIGNTNHELSGGGIWCEPGSAVVSNCVIISNAADLYGGGAYGGNMINCQLVGNSSGIGGGADDSTLSNCILVSNYSSAGAEGEGGGACNSTLTNCVLMGNLAAGGGGGAAGGILVNCQIISNTAAGASSVIGGGGAYGATLSGCLLMGNSVTQLSLGGGAFNCVLNNCTVVNNAGPVGGGTAGGTNNNCIVMFNNATQGVSNNYLGGTFNYCDTAPLPPSSVGNISADPQLSDTYHIAAYSPCHGAGNSAFATGTDLDGEPWLNPPSIGCEEYYGLGPLSVSITANYANVVAGFSLNFAGQITGAVGSMVWNFGDGSTATNIFSTTHTWQSTGNYTVTLTVYNATNPGGVSASTGVRVVAQPVHYVSPASANPVSPYSSWATAATNIQDAVDATSATLGELVIVSNGVYNFGGRVVPPFALTNRLAVTNPVTVQSINGAAVTVIQGSQAAAYPSAGSNAVRCVWLGDSASLTGFTLINGASAASSSTNDGSGGGIWCATTNAVVSNCIIISNNVFNGGGGAYGGSLTDCFIVNNSAGTGGGAYNSLINGSVIVSNGGGEGGGGAFGGALNNCLILGNQSSTGGGAYRSTLVNCTVVGNYGSFNGGGVYGGATVDSILISNSSSTGPNYYFGTMNFGAVDYCCTFPVPATGVGNFTNDPLFVSFTNGNFQLQSNSPCINAGNNAYTVGPTDLAGNPRISGGTVDIGASEFQNPTSIISYAWLEQYGLATDGSADFADEDNNGMNNWQKWVAGLNPTNAASVLQVLSPVTNGPNLVVTWQSVVNINYFLQRSSSLAPGSFQTIVTNIAGLAGTTSYTDTNAPAPGPWYYRVGVP